LKKPSFQKKETFQQKISAQHPETMSKICMYIYIYIIIWWWVKTLYPCSSHQKSLDLWMFIPK
jgi:hypothetical protein